MSRRLAAAVAAVAVVAGVAVIAAGGDGRPAAGAWRGNFTITEYWPVPERWFRGKRVRAAGLPGTHRVDWLYSGTGLLMEADGVTLANGRVHVEDFARPRWINPAGRLTRPTASGRWTHGDPAWAAGGWRNAASAVTFPLEGGGWSNGPAVRYTPVKGVTFARGASLPLRYWNSVAVDPRVIPSGSRIYIPAYRSVNGGWFVAKDTGSAIVGRHIDVFRPPPRTPDGGRFLQHQRVRILPPPRRR